MRGKKRVFEVWGITEKCEKRCVFFFLGGGEEISRAEMMAICDIKRGGWIRGIRDMATIWCVVCVCV